MKYRISFGLLALVFFALLPSCANQEEEKEYIGEVDFSVYQAELAGAQSAEESSYLDSMIFQQIEMVSVGKHIPAVAGLNNNGQSVQIDQLINQNTLVILYSPFYGWGSVDLVKELPSSLEKLDNPPHIICLLLKEDRPELNLPEDFYQVQQEQISFLYPDFFIVDASEMRKLNMYALPTRYYFNSDKKLVKLSKGAIPQGRLINEMREAF